MKREPVEYHYDVESGESLYEIWKKMRPGDRIIVKRGVYTLKTGTCTVGKK